MNINDNFSKNGYPLPLHKLRFIPEDECTNINTDHSILINGKIIPKEIIFQQGKHISKIIPLKFVYENL